MVYRNRGRFVSGALVAAAVHFWISQNILGSLAAEQMRQNIDANFARARQQIQSLGSTPHQWGGVASPGQTAANSGLSIQEQMQGNTEASFARAKKQMEEWDSRPSGARRAPAIVIPTPIPLPGAPQVPRPQPHFLNPPKNASRFSLRLFVALPGTALAELVAPPSSEAPAQRASFYPLEMPSTASRVALE